MKAEVLLTMIGTVAAMLVVLFVCAAGQVAAGPASRSSDRRTLDEPVGTRISHHQIRRSLAVDTARRRLSCVEW